MTTKSRFKILIGRFEDYSGNRTPEYREVSFEELCEAKGIKSLSKRTDQFNYRARTDRPKLFKGGTSSQLVRGNKIIPKSPTLEELVAKNDIQGYVSAFRAINHITN